MTALTKTVRGITINYVKDKDQSTEIPYPVEGLIQFSQDIYLRPPYLSESITFSYQDNEFLQRAKKIAETESLDPDHHTASVITSDGIILGEAANGSPYHQKHGCERKRRGVPSGEGYKLCKGCHPKNHSEPKAIKQAIENGHEKLLPDATLYLYGHCWSCQSCCDAMEKVGIRRVVFSRSWTKEFLEI